MAHTGYLTTLSTALLVGGMIVGSAPVLAQWKPTRNVEFIVPLAAGGGTDVTVRHLQAMFQKHKLIPTTMSVVNKPGAASAIGYAYMNQRRGDGHYVSIGMAPLYINALTGKHPLTYKDVTLICNLYAEYTVLYVREASPIKSGKDLAERLRKDPKSVSFGLTALGAGHHLSIAKLATELNQDPRDLRVVVFNSAGEAATAVRGGHIDALVGSAAGTVAQLQAGGIRVLGIAAPKRLEHGALAEIPTWREQGYNVVTVNWRGIVGPAGMSKEQIAYSEDTFERLTKTPEWKALLEKNGWSETFQRSEEFAQFVRDVEAEDSTLLRKLGLIK
jgi:putative tricarboxylic transport membrane protein